MGVIKAEAQDTNAKQARNKNAPEGSSLRHSLFSALQTERNVQPWDKGESRDEKIVYCFSSLR